MQLHHSGGDLTQQDLEGMRLTRVAGGYLVVADVDVSVDGDGHDAHEGAEAGRCAHGRDYPAQRRVVQLEPQLPVNHACASSKPCHAQI